MTKKQNRIRGICGSGFFSANRGRAKHIFHELMGVLLKLGYSNLVINGMIIHSRI